MALLYGSCSIEKVGNTKTYDSLWFVEKFAVTMQKITGYVYLHSDKQQWDSNASHSLYKTLSYHIIISVHLFAFE